MCASKLSHLADHVLLREFLVLVKQDRFTTAALLAHMAEVDLRRLYAPAGHPSMYAYCVQELRMSEDAAYRRISAARTAREFPAIFSALAEGRLNLTAVLLLAPHLTPGNAAELLEAAMQKTKSEIECVLAERFPRPDVPTVVQPISFPAPADESSAELVEPGASQLALERVVPSVQSRNAVPVGPLPARTRLAVLSPGRYELQVTVDGDTYETLRHAQSLLGHAVPSGDIAQVLKRALDALVQKLEKQKFAKCARAGRNDGKARGRYIPARIRRAVSERDHGQCTFVNERGERCPSRTRLEFDHVKPVARGGETTVSNLRLRCRAHNQYEAERTFGAAFMAGKREHSQPRAACLKQEKSRLRTTEQAPPAMAARAQHCSSQDPSTPAAPDRDVTPWLRALGLTAREARRGAELCEHLAGATIEERVRVALRGLAPRCVHHAAPAPMSVP